MTKDPLFVFNSWAGASLLDGWTLIHFLGWAAFGYVCRIFGVSLVATCIIGICIVVGWKVYEKVAKIDEPWTNTIVDIVIGISAVILAYVLMPTASFRTEISIALLLAVLTFALNVWAWISWNGLPGSTKSTHDTNISTNEEGS
ncbi:MAG: hypothetical protein AAB460_00490 [Patescibacteria group bacterium]